MRQTFILTQNQQKVGLSPTVNTLAWEWIMIIVAGCFLFVVFLALISKLWVNLVYEWGCNGYRGEKMEEKREEGKNPETDKEIIKNGDEMMKGKESQSEAMIVENIAWFSNQCYTWKVYIKINKINYQFYHNSASIISPLSSVMFVFSRWFEAKSHLLTLTFSFNLEN